MATRAQLVAQARAAATAAGIDADIFERQIDQESGFNPSAKSSAGALGIAQMMPATARALGIDPMNSAQALPAAAKLMATYLRQFGSYELALAAYNAGPGAVQQYGGVPPYAETQSYVSTILGSQTTKATNEPAGGPTMPTPPMTLEELQKLGKDFMADQPKPTRRVGRDGKGIGWDHLWIHNNGDAEKWYQSDENPTLQETFLSEEDVRRSRAQKDIWDQILEDNKKQRTAWDTAQAAAAKKGTPSSIEVIDGVPQAYFDAAGNRHEMSKGEQDRWYAQHGIVESGTAKPRRIVEVNGVMVEEQPILRSDGSKTGETKWVPVYTGTTKPTSRQTIRQEMQDGSVVLLDADTGAFISTIRPADTPTPTDLLNTEKLRQELLGPTLVQLQEAERTIEYIRDQIATGKMSAKQGSAIMEMVNRQAEATLRGTSPWAIENAYRQNRLRQMEVGQSLLNQRLQSGTALMNSILSSAGAAMMPKGLSSLGINPVAMAQGFTDRMQGGPGVSEIGRKLLEGLGTTQEEAGKPGPAIDFSPLEMGASDPATVLAAARAKMDTLKQAQPNMPVSPNALRLD